MCERKRKFYCEHYRQSMIKFKLVLPQDIRSERKSSSGLILFTLRDCVPNKTNFKILPWNFDKFGDIVLFTYRLK